uniref:HRAS-like suppressor 3 n=1 Tax=Caligus clemensi TaxID=344056 RepID=C1C2Z4_CALCM|nr:HRAS-like suppressor 3 [Caligus clemensi]
MSNYGLRSPDFSLNNLEDFLTIVEEGDLIEFLRGWYNHWAVYAGKGYVVHLSNDATSLVNVSATFRSTNISPNKATKGHPAKERLCRIIEDSKYRINNTQDFSRRPFDKNSIVSRMYKEMSLAKAYDLIGNNCEHFAKKIRNGTAESKQVEATISSVLVATAGMAIVGLMGFAARRNKNSN